MGVAPLQPTPAPPYQLRGYGCAAKPPLWVEGPGSLPLCTTAHGAGGWGGGRATVASADGRPLPAHLSQGAWNTTCTLRRCHHASTSARTVSHARAWASSPARGYRCCGGGWGDPGAGVTAYHTAYARGMEASTAPAAASGSWGATRDVSPLRRHPTVPPWVTPTQWPPEPSASSSHPSTRSTRRWGALA